MKNALYGTTALVAMSLAAGQASADSALKLGITGFYRGAAGLVTGGESALGRTTFGFNTTSNGFGDYGRTGGGFRQEIRINFTGRATLDNGLTVGVLVGLNGENLIGTGSTSTPVKQSYVDFSGKFGNVRFGEASSALTTSCIGDPGNVTANFGVNSPNESFSNAGRAVPLTVALANRTAGVAPIGSIGTCYGIEARGTKIGYFTPSIGGFTFAISYAPSGSTRNPGGGYFYGSDLKSKAAMNVLSVGADFDHDFGGGTTLTIGGGGEWALDSYTGFGGSNPDKPSTYALGAQLGIGGFTVGASGAYVNNYRQAGYAATDAGPNDDGWIATVGGSYTIQAWSIGLQGMYSRWQVYGQRDHDAIWGVSLNGSYVLGPGISLEGQVAYTKYDANQLFGGPGQVFPNRFPAPGYVNPMNYDAVELDAGFAINF